MKKIGLACRACAHAFAWLLVSGAREYPQAPLDVAELETPERRGFGYGVHSAVQACSVVYSAGRGLRCACGGNACAYRLVSVSLGVGMLRGLLERAKLLFAIVDLMSVNGTAFRQLRVACETHTGVFRLTPCSCWSPSRDRDV
eukprot:scaffold1054_cov116-Isochrysis_galbana.AAC.25